MESSGGMRGGSGSSARVEECDLRFFVRGWGRLCVKHDMSCKPIIHYGMH